MAGTLTFLLISSLLQGALCRTFNISMPQNINVLRGSCVTIPCSFDVESRFEDNLDDTCKAYWSDSPLFSSRNAKLKPTKEMTGDLKKKDCTTTFNNADFLQSTKYYFRLECNNALKYIFSQAGVDISFIDVPPSPTLTPSTLEVKEGTSVSLTCSAPAPCWSHPPALTWSPNLGQSQETLQENQDKTKVKTSVMNFTASHLHHGNKISCTAVYQKQDGSPDVTAETSLTPDISSGTWGIKMPQNINVMSGTCVTIPCFFDVASNHKINLDDTCKAYWSDSLPFNSENAKLKPTKDMTGDLTKKDCTTTFNNASLLQSTKYYFRLECDNALKYTFSQTGVNISSIDDPPSLTLTPSTLEVKEGTSVSLTCSAPAPCWSHPPALTWSPNLGQSQETLQEHQDKTKVKTSVLSFTASHLHHGNKISCTAVYQKQDGSPDVTAETSLTPDISSGTWGIKMPQNINVMSGTCVTIPCFFDVASNHKINLDDTCKAYWSDSLPFNSENAKLKPTKDMTGDLTKKDCTTTFNNASLLQSTKYYFRLECDNALKYTFSQTGVNISSIDDPPSLTLTPSTLEVKEGTSVSLTCSAPAPCWSHPPALTWSPNLGQSQETLQENQDKTKVKTSVMSFTASHLHHGNKISCTAVYQKQDGSPDVTAETSLTPDISSGTWGIKMPQNINVMSGTCVTIPCFFDVASNHKINLDDTCKAYWSDSLPFNSGNAKLKPTKDMTGDLTKKDCTTTFNNASLLQRSKYYFRLECDNALKYTFTQAGVDISFIDPPSPTLIPSPLEVKEGASVSLTCSAPAPAPCWSHPPALTWSPNLGQSQETLQENQDKTKVRTSVMNFTASHLHHGNKISCTAVYQKQDGSPDVTAETSLTPDISILPQILFSSDCVRTASQVNCSCDTEGNPSPAVQWYLNGEPVNQSGGFEIFSEILNLTVHRSSFILSQPQVKHFSTLLCRSFNSLGSASQLFYMSKFKSSAEFQANYERM
uniref:Ig-like domain-containing protein n=1 Tax=Oreochromis niloticus TaxID=8128 RepID=A0A669EF18_ORENI